MSDREPSPASPDEELNPEADPNEAARQAAMLRKVIREQERHREGGIEPELADDDAAVDPPMRGEAKRSAGEPGEQSITFRNLHSLDVRAIRLDMYSCR